VLRAERAAGRLPAGACLALGAWVAHLQGVGAPVVDARAALLVRLADGRPDEAARRVLDALDPAVGEDDDVVATVAETATRLRADA
jgi:fructuronate reductase